MKFHIADSPNKNSPGPDGIACEFLKASCNYVSSFLTILFNQIFSSGQFPKCWGKSIICPLFKSGCKNDPNNYRGISLMDSTCKIFTSILNKRLQNWCESHEILSESQAGFRANYSTVDHIFPLQALVQKYCSKKKGRFYCLFIDFSKAFDTIRHDVLIQALYEIGVSGKFIDVIKSMYGNLSACVRTTKGLSKCFTCNIGTRQGCVLSPQMFIIFINKLCTLMEREGGRGVTVSSDIYNLCSLMFADDVSALSDTCILLQNKISVLEKFCEQTGMSVNLNKTKILVFRNGGPLRDYEKWYYNGKQIETVSFYKYLGLVFTPKLLWTKAHTCLVSQASKAIFSVHSFQRNVGSIS